MENIFVKKYWEEEKILFFLHFQDGEAVRQIEVTDLGNTYLSLDFPVVDGSMLYDQLLSELELSNDDFITEEEFNNHWKI